jgi:hypothetical protein
MDTTPRDLIIQHWNVVQYELLPEFKEQTSSLTAKLEKLMHTLEWVGVEEFVESSAWYQASSA